MGTARNHLGVFHIDPYPFTTLINAPLLDKLLIFSSIISTPWGCEGTVAQRCTLYTSRGVLHKGVCVEANMHGCLNRNLLFLLIDLQYFCLPLQNAGLGFMEYHKLIGIKPTQQEGVCGGMNMRHMKPVLLKAG